LQVIISISTRRIAQPAGEPKDGSPGIKFQSGRSFTGFKHYLRPSVLRLPTLWKPIFPTKKDFSTGL
jgi:hypothetical protein